MKKFIIIFSLGISLLVVGGIVFATELSQFTPYDIISNDRDLPVVRKTDVFDISDIKGPIYFSSDYSLGAYSGHGYNHSILDTNEIEIFEDEDQTEGSITVDIAYLSDVGVNNCRVDFGNIDDGYFKEHTIKGNTKKHGMMKGEHHGRRISKDYNVDTNRGVIGMFQCDDYFMFSNINIMKHDNFKYFMREKQLPVEVSKMVIVVNPNDAHKFR